MTSIEEGRRTAVLTFFISFTILIANGRPIGSGDTNAVEKTAASLAERGTFLLPDDGTPDPFTRPVPGGRISIYPALPALLAVPFFFAFRLLFDLNLAGLQVAGKLSAALMAALATALLARSFAKRAQPSMALGAALLFGLGTTVYSTAQALWQHPAVLLFMVAALSALERVLEAEGEERLRPGLIAALALSLAAAARPAAIPMCAFLFLFLLKSARAFAGRLLAVAILPAALVAFYNATFFGAAWRFGPVTSGRFMAAFPESMAGLLFSPARGLLVFTPIALVALLGLVASLRRWPLARALLGALAIHFLFMATWNEWHGGESFGPRLLTDMLPALFFFLPEGLALWPNAGALLGVISVAVQLLGGWTYDYRWERLHQRGQEFGQALWSWRDSPLVFAAREGVLIQGIPEVEGRRVRVRLHRFVPFGPAGSVVEPGGEALRVSGAELIRDIRLERGARVKGPQIVLGHPGDALAFRSESGGSFSLHLGGSLQGVLRIETPSASASVPVNGDFDWTVPIHVAEGDDIFIRAEKGELRLFRVEVKP